VIPKPTPDDLAAAAEPWAHARADRWAPVPAELDRAIAADVRVAEAARWARRHLLRDAVQRLGDLVPAAAVARYAAVLRAVPRERFVLPEDMASSADDTPSPLDREGLATVSAPHAYVLTYGLLELSAGDHLLELGSGTGYGAAIASQIVGAGGRVTSIEIDAELHARAARLLAEPELSGPARVTLLHGDARALARPWMTPARSSLASHPLRPLRVAVTYAMPEPPEDLLALLPEGGRLVAPVCGDAPAAAGGEYEQRLVRWTRVGGALQRTTHGAVRYVPERGAGAAGTLEGDGQRAL
jgi:protein-L-isoaspartate(D-aspartate) O-methyltransferase